MKAKHNRRRHGEASLRPSVEAMARRIRKSLVAAASHRQTITYGTLMKKFRLSRGRALSGMIGVVDRREYAIGAPGFAALIVRKDTGFPGGGYFRDDELPRHLQRPRSRSGDPKLSSAERSYIRAQQERIWRHYSEARRG